jgi:hypothetical protein
MTELPKNPMRSVAGARLTAGTSTPPLSAGSGHRPGVRRVQHGGAALKAVGRIGD